MKVLVFTTQFYQLNGAERLGVELAESLNKYDDVQAALASMYGSDVPGVTESEQQIRSKGVSGFHYLNLNVHPGPAAVVRAVLQLRTLLRTEQFDIVETSQVTPTILASWASWGLKTKHVSGVHDVFTKDRYNGLRHKLWRFSVQGQRCAKFYAISEYVRKHWIEYTHSPPDKTQTILNAIPNDCFDATPDRDTLRAELGIPNDGKIALFVGRMLKRKGIDTILESLGPILQENNLHLVYVGEWGYHAEGFFPGEDTLQEEMLKTVAQSEWGDHVHFAGRRADVPRVMASSDLLVHPARIEGFGLVLAEAMAAGLPVVATTVQGIPEVVADTDSILVAPDNPEAVREAVLKTLRRPTKPLGPFCVGEHVQRYFESNDASMRSITSLMK